MSAPSTTLWSRVSDYLTAEGLDLDDLDVAGHGGARIVRVVIDGEELTVDRLADLSRSLSRLIEEEVGDVGSLEVSSPGLERKLKRPEQFRKAVGQKITVKTREEIDGRRRHEGVLTDTDVSTFVVDVEGRSTTVAYEQVTSARTVFTWERNPKPGSQAARSN